ncbi:4-formylbenzenesulfonate dehydrogenase TsaC1/TsaC2 [Trichoderma ghanense]|uniref:4-formylbenzenesulfonate dehydrogenase TsaC1/TsaC2 n=1 Tax=Trichoderma ghanense TaxID=65468 RepID=A0ABY2GSU4_9HYPO
MPSNRLEGKVAVITGAASGFGKGIATKFAQEGAKVIVADLSQEVGQQVASELAGVFIRTDVTQRSDWEAVLALALKEYGQLDIVVNNAGASYSNKATEGVTEQEFDMVMNVNVKSIYFSTNVIVPYFLKENRPGSFIQIASTAGVRPRGGLAWYSASKGAAITATKALASEYGPKQIRFNAVSPVVGITGMTNLFLGSTDISTFVSTVPLGRPSTPADIANACCYLASDEASFITGVNLEVDGGRCV